MKSVACLEALQLAEVFPEEYKARTIRYSQCKCTSSDYLNLSAEKCELDATGQPTATCIPCEIGTSTSNVCGTWTYTYSDCDTTCGFGKQSRTDCFTFFAADKNVADQCIVDAASRDCEVPCTWNACVCEPSETNLAPVAFKTQQNDPTVSEACSADEAVEACGEYIEPTFGECSAECGTAERTVKKCFLYNADNGNVEVCVDSVEACPDLGPCFGDCECKSIDALNLVAKKCETDNPDACEPCDTSVCGEFGEPTTGECSTTCGPGVREVKSCFEWEAGAVPENVRLAQQCRSANEACNEEPENACATFDNCVCTSDDKDNLSAEESDQFGNKRPCDAAICGAFTNWSNWGDCSATCDGGVQSRNRCFEFANDAADQCEDEEQACNENECPKWAAWKAWSACDGQCADGDNVPKDRFYFSDDSSLIRHSL